MDVSRVFCFVIVRMLTLWVELLQGTKEFPCTDIHIKFLDSSDENDADCRPRAIAMDCEMVGGGSDGSLELCARVCLVDEDENLIFHTYVKPQIPVTNYRYFILLLYDCFPILSKERIR